jgi:predicted DCC family thiol-disulfide oxidoreductase YuxK
LAPSSPAALTILFDGGCPLCRAEIATYQRAAGGDGLNWVDAHGCGVVELGAGLDRPAALARLHVRRSDGTLVQGAAAFAEVWSALPNWRLLARVARLPGALILAARLRLAWVHLAVLPFRWVGAEKSKETRETVALYLEHSCGEREGGGAVLAASSISRYFLKAQTRHGGGAGSNGADSPYGAGGGGAGACINGNSNITWIAFGTRLGSIS